MIQLFQTHARSAWEQIRASFNSCSKSEIIWSVGEIFASYLRDGFAGAIAVLSIHATSRIFLEEKPKIVVSALLALNIQSEFEFVSHEKPFAVEKKQSRNSAVDVKDDFEDVKMSNVEQLIATEIDTIQYGVIELGKRALGTYQKVSLGLKGEAEIKRISEEMMVNFFEKMQKDHPELESSSLEMYTLARKKIVDLLFKSNNLSRSELERCLRRESLFPKI